jgi:hypothetical protein
MFIADAVDENSDLDASTGTSPCVQRGSGDSKKRLGSVTPFIGRNPYNVASTLGWRGRVIHSQEATQATSSRRLPTAEERWRASLEIEIKRIRQHYYEQEKILEREIVKHEQRYENAMRELEQEEEDDEDHPVAEWWEVQSDYQPTECGNDGSGYLMPERRLEQQAIGQSLQSLKGQDFSSVSPPAAKNPSFAGSKITEEHKRPHKKRAARR